MAFELNADGARTLRNIPTTYGSLGSARALYLDQEQPAKLSTERQDDGTRTLRNITATYGSLGGGRALYLDQEQPAELSTERQMEMAQMVAFGNRNLSGLDTLYADHEAMRANTNVVCPARREFQRELIQSWNTVLEQATTPVYAGIASVTYLRSLRELILQSGRHKRAYDLWFDHLMYQDQDPQRSFIIAAELERTCHFQEAADQYRSLIKLNPDDGIATIGLCRSLIRSGQESAALQIMSRLGDKLKTEGPFRSTFFLGIVFDLFDDNAGTIPEGFADTVAGYRDEYCHYAILDAGLIRSLMVLFRNPARRVDSKLVSVLTRLQASDNLDKNKNSSMDNSDLDLRNRALSLIYGRLLDIPPNRELEWRLDPLNVSRICVKRMVALTNEGQAHAALRESASALAHYQVTDIPPVINLVGAYKVIKNKNLYYAVPRDLVDFQIFSGRIIRVPAVAYQIRALVPRRLVHLAKRFYNVLMLRGRVDGPLVHQSFAMRVMRFVVLRPARALYRGAFGRLIKRMLILVFDFTLSLVTQKPVKVSASLGELLEELRAV